MSTSNIVSIEPVGGAIGNVFEASGIGEAVGGSAIIVTFRTHRGSEVRYMYTGEAAEAISSGDDPAGWSGTRMEE